MHNGRGLGCCRTTRTCATGAPRICHRPVTATIARGVPALRIMHDAAPCGRPILAPPAAVPSDAMAADVAVGILFEFSLKQCVAASPPCDHPQDRHTGSTESPLLHIAP